MNLFARTKRWAEEIGTPWIFVALVEVVLVLFVLWGIWQYRQVTVERVESRDIISSADQTLLALLDAETGERGYIITQDSSYLPPYYDGVEQAEISLERLTELTEGNEAYEDLVAEIETLTEAKLAKLAESVLLVSRGEVEAAVALVQTNLGQELMVEIRELLGTIRDEEVAEFDGILDREDRTVVLLAVTAISLAVVTLGIVTWLLLSVRREQQARAARSAAVAKDEFVGFVSHELRTPISIVAGNARLLEGDGSVGEEERREAVAEIGSATERMESIVATLLSLAKAEGGSELEVEPIQVHRIAAGALRLHRSRYPARALELQAADGLPPAMGNQDAVEQIFVNLLSNAERYGDPLTPIVIEVKQRDRFVIVCVTNSAAPDSPVNAAALDRVFEPFFRSPATAHSVEGVGLGLTICHRLVVAQGGRLAARVTESGDIEFSFSLVAATTDGLGA